MSDLRCLRFNLRRLRSKSKYNLKSMRILKLTNSRTQIWNKPIISRVIISSTMKSQMNEISGPWMSEVLSATMIGSKLLTLTPDLSRMRFNLVMSEMHSMQSQTSENFVLGFYINESRVPTIVTTNNLIRLRLHLIRLRLNLIHLRLEINLRRFLAYPPTTCKTTKTKQNKTKQTNKSLTFTSFQWWRNKDVWVDWFVTIMSTLDSLMWKTCQIFRRLKFNLIGLRLMNGH